MGLMDEILKDFIKSTPKNPNPKFKSGDKVLYYTYSVTYSPSKGNFERGLDKVPGEIVKDNKDGTYEFKPDRSPKNVERIEGKYIYHR